MKLFQIQPYTKVGIQPPYLIFLCTMVHSTTKASHCTSCSDMIMIVNRRYYTPFKLAKIFSTASPMCLCECGQIGNLLHCLWNCPCLTSFWSNFFLYWHNSQPPTCHDPVKPLSCIPAAGGYLHFVGGTHTYP